jgi:uncharacterized protein (TIGR02246 family)
MAMHAAGAERRDFIPYPTNRVVGTIGEPDSARAALEALLRAGFGQADIDILQGEGGLARLDPTGAEHGFLAQFRRTLIRTLDLEQFKHLTHHVEDVRAGRYVIMVLARRRIQRSQAADILNRHGAEFVGFYGRWAVEELPPAAQAAPEDIPALFAKAWNNRDADALAALFDEDAEFVSASGHCWHDRESIRRHGLADVPDEATLAPDETKVKLLSPEIAVVHARMTVADGPPAAGAAPSSPRTTIVSFVAHRAGNRWLCAAAHSTSVAPELDTTAVPAT